MKEWDYMKLLHRLDEFLTSLSVIKFIIIITSGMILGSFIFGVVSFVISNVFCGTETISVEPHLTQESFVTQFIYAVILAPLLETFLFQMCVIKILRKINKLNNSIVVIISALIFGLQHFYSLEYILNTTIAGIFLAYAFITYEKKKLLPFCVVCIIHSLRNFISLIISYFITIS